MQQQEQALAFRFSGKGSEYFRIWIVNLCLTLLTLGIYSAWAKVRRLRYFYTHTSVADSGFDYHGDPLMILKGRLIAFGLFLAYYLSNHLLPPLGLAVTLVIAALMPWLLQRALRFRARYSSWRGLRFGFQGTVKDSYFTFLLWPVLSLFTLNLLFPAVHRQIKNYQHGNSVFGHTPFSFTARIGGFYKIYLAAGLLGLVSLFAAVFLFVPLAQSGAFGPATGPQAMILGFMAMIVMMFAVMILVTPYFTARLQNLVWNGTALGEHRLSSDVSALKLYGLYFTNLLGIVLTLGLFKPFADIRLARYRVESMALVPSGDLDSFVAGQQPESGAAGDEVAEMFDLDIGM